MRHATRITERHSTNAQDALPVPLRPTSLGPVNRARLARYLEVPSAAQIDPITDEEIRRLDDRRNELLSIWHRAVATSIDRIAGRWIELKNADAAIESTEAYAELLLESGADQLIVASFTIGGRVDALIRQHLARQDVYEAFVLKQWAATMAEQARAALTRGLRAWAGSHGRALLPYDGPGYNGWPLASVGPLLEMLYSSDDPHAAQPIRATDAGVLLPTNSMLIVYGMTCRRDVTASVTRRDDRLAQCHRCAMPNCRYRLANFELSR